MISKRLFEITKFLNKDDIILDVGCDHAKLAIYLFKKGYNISVSDVSLNALNNGIKNIEKENLDIKSYLSDGLKDIKNEFNTIIISGMGGFTINKIVENYDYDKYIIQPNNNNYEVRKLMNKKGYMIKDESIVSDSNYIYETMVFIKGNKKYSKKELLYGPLLLKEKSDLFKAKHIKELNSLVKVYNKMDLILKIRKIKILFKIFELKKILK